MISTDPGARLEGIHDTDVLTLLTAPNASGTDRLETDPGVVELFLVVMRPSEPSGIAGWECSVLAEEPVKLVSADFEGKAINVGRASSEFIVGLATPLPRADIVLLATLRFYVPTSQASFIHFGPVSRPSIAGEMIYAAGKDPGIFTRLRWPVADKEDEPVFHFNAGNNHH